MIDTVTRMYYRVYQYSVTN